MAVKNETDLLSYQNDEQYLSPSNIASLLQNMLNTAAGSAMFRVYTDAKTEPTDNVPYVCILKTRVEPFSLRGTDCETIVVRLTCKIPVDNAVAKNKAVGAMQKTLGPMSGSFTLTDASGENIEYTFFSNFRLNEMSDPGIVNSDYVGNFVLEGNMHVTRSGGGVLGDRIKTYINIRQAIDGVIVEGDYEIICKNAQTGCSAAIDTPIKAGSFMPDAEYNALSFSTSLLILYRNDHICRLLRDYIHGELTDEDNPFIDSDSGKLVMWLKFVYPDKEILNPYFISEISENKEAGVYNTISATLIKGKKATLILSYFFSISGDTCSVGGYTISSGVSDETTLFDVTIPETYDGTKVTAIYKSAFYNCDKLTSVKIPNGVTRIGVGAFEHCINLKSVTIGNSVTSIGDDVFYGCSSLTIIGVDQDNRAYSSIDGVLFSKDQTVLICFPGGKKGGYTLPNSVTSIENYAFANCRSLTSVTIPNTVTSIGSGAFYNCPSLTSVTIGNGVTSIGNSAFANCYSLTGLYISDIAAWCSISFDGNYSNPLSYAHDLYLNGELVTELKIPNGVTEIKDSLFAYCDKLTSVKIPNGVTRIGYSAFRGCTSLTSITLPFIGEKSDGTGVAILGYIFGTSNYVDQSSYIPSSLKTVIITGGGSIAAYAFYYCIDLEYVTIGESVTMIGKHAFQNCRSLTSIIIPNSVTNITDWAISYCYNLTEIIYQGTEIEWNKITKGTNWDYKTGTSTAVKSYLIRYQYTIVKGTKGETISNAGKWYYNADNGSDTASWAFVNGDPTYKDGTITLSYQGGTSDDKIYLRYQPADIAEGEEYTVTFTATLNRTGEKTITVFNDNINKFYHFNTIAGEEQTITATFTVSSAGPLQIRVNCFDGTESNPVVLTIKDFTATEKQSS